MVEELTALQKKHYGESSAAAASELTQQATRLNVAVGELYQVLTGQNHS